MSGKIAMDVGARFWARVERSAGCWLWTGATNKGGYGAIKVGSRSDNSCRTLGAHRVAWVLTYGPLDKALYVCHRCDKPLCVRPDHLFVAAQTENMRDMVNKRRCLLGEAHQSSKLTELHVAEIRATARRGNYSALARHYGVSAFTIRAIVNRRIWK